MEEDRWRRLFFLIGWFVIPVAFDGDARSVANEPKGIAFGVLDDHAVTLESGGRDGKCDGRGDHLLLHFSFNPSIKDLA